MTTTPATELKEKGPTSIASNSKMDEDGDGDAGLAKERQTNQSTAGTSEDGSSSTNTRMKMITMLIQGLVHLFGLALYMIPLFQPNYYAGPTLDELHIMSLDNHDIHGDSTIVQIFQNDYWGRPMQSESSHKSWRPLTVLSFRHLKGLYTSSQLTTHRIVNILTHAAAAEVVGILAVRLFGNSILRQQVNTTQQQQQLHLLLLRLLTKIVFLLHPTHVEVTANCANRNHILAVLCSTILCDVYIPFGVFAVSLICGFLCSETFLFQVPAAMVTSVVIQYYTTYNVYNNNESSSPKQQDPNQNDNNSNDNNSHNNSVWAVVKDYILATMKVLPRLIVMIVSIAIYLGGRAYFDTLNIPEGLIRPAENPFYHFQGEHRVRNYLYTLAVHIAKSWGIDPIGFSHEYGFDCIPPLKDWNDPRLSLPYGIGLALLLSLGLVFVYPRRLLGLIVIHWAWLFTLFPISGIVKVGTFIADRIVVASTVSVSLWIGYGLYYWFTNVLLLQQQSGNGNGGSGFVLPAKPLQCILVGWLFSISYIKVHKRTLQWMDSVSLLDSALQTCPRFAKAHMEVSKIHSGMYPGLFDLAKSRRHLEMARGIDPDLCDVHQQFAHVAIQQGNYLEYEDELTQAVLCPFTMGGAFPMWQNYWKVALNAATTPEKKRQVQERREHYGHIIQMAVEKAQREDAEKEKKQKKQ